MNYLVLAGVVLFWALVVLALKHERTRAYARPAIQFLFDRLLPAGLFSVLVYANFNKIGEALAGGEGWLPVLPCQFPPHPQRSCLRSP